MKNKKIDHLIGIATKLVEKGMSIKQSIKIIRAMEDWSDWGDWNVKF